MARTSRNKLYMRVTILGVISLISYYLLFTNLDYVMEYFIKGGPYAALPILTALYFSFVHGAFASGMLSILRLTPRGH
ncbi:MAG TPA: hypothetical protein VE131_03620 [Terriglobales bacterium]|nr:hypothetical protein [Terriglobales bacterium]